MPVGVDLISPGARDEVAGAGRCARPQRPRAVPEGHAEAWPARDRGTAHERLAVVVFGRGLLPCGGAVRGPAS